MSIEEETREEYLERLLAELIDAVVGSSYHDLHGWSYSPEEIAELKEIHRNYWDRFHGRTGVSTND